jgi:hypothetical protein
MTVWFTIAFDPFAPDMHDALISAASLGQLGDQPNARQWFDQAVKWMDKYQPKNEELGRFRADAEALTRR